MSTNQGAVEVYEPEDAPDFLKDSVDLKSVHTKLKGVSKKAIETLEKALDSEDEKIASSAAIKLLELGVQVAKEINSDKLTRLIAKVKLGSGRGVLVPVGNKKAEEEPEDVDTKPKSIVDFTTIQQV